MGRQTLSTVKLLCVTMVTSNDRVPLTYFISFKLFHSNYSKVWTTKLVQIMPEMVFYFKVENDSSGIYLLPWNIFAPAHEQTRSWNNHRYKLRKFLKTIKKDCSKHTLRNPKQHDYTRSESFKWSRCWYAVRGPEGIRCHQLHRLRLWALPSPCVVSSSVLCSYNRIVKTGWFITNKNLLVNGSGEVWDKRTRIWQGPSWCSIPRWKGKERARNRKGGQTHPSIMNSLPLYNAWQSHLWGHSPPF